MVTIKEHNERYLEAMNYIMETRGLTMDSFAKSLEVARTLLSHIKNGKQNASIDLLSKTVFVYPEINADYIIANRGSMFINSSTTADAEEAANDEIIKLHRELEDAYIQLNAAHAEIGRLSMELKSAQQHNLSKKIG